MKSAKLFVFTLVVAIVALAATTIGFAQEATCETVVVLPENILAAPAPNTTPAPYPQGSFVKFTRGGGNASLVVGPENPPLGVGSLNLNTPGTPPASDKVYLFNYDHRGTLLSSVDAISYSTYRYENSTANPLQTTAINIEIDRNGGTLEPGDYAVLVFEPVYNINQGPVVEGEWQDWDAYAGGQAIWWSSRAIPGVCAFDCFVTWDAIVAANPNATIVGGFGVNQGGGNDGLFAATDALKLGYGDDCVIYNFEPYRVATTRDACKNGGWQSAKRADGTSFRNQGDCVSYVNNGK